MLEAGSGIEALLGRVQVGIAGTSVATFEFKPGHPTVEGKGSVATIIAPGGTIGRGDRDDLRVVGPASREVSRGHLLVQPSGRQWTVTDCGSRNLTYEEDFEEGGWRQLPSDFPIPVTKGLVLGLGEQLQLRFGLIPPALPGGTTTGRRGNKGMAPERVRPVELERVAAALLGPRRANRLDRRVPSDKELTAELFMPKATLHRRFEKLAELPGVEVQPGDRKNLTDALEQAFPYLLAAPPPGRS